MTPLSLKGCKEKKELKGETEEEQELSTVRIKADELYMFRSGREVGQDEKNDAGRVYSAV